MNLGEDLNGELLKMQNTAAFKNNNAIVIIKSQGENTRVPKVL